MPPLASSRSAALHSCAARASADEQRDVDAVEGDVRIVGDLDSGEQRKRAVVELHRGSLRSLDGGGNLEQAQRDRRVGPEHRAARDAEQQGVADLTGRTCHGDLDGAFWHQAFTPRWRHRTLCGPRRSGVLGRLWGVAMLYRSAPRRPPTASAPARSLPSVHATATRWHGEARTPVWDPGRRQPQLVPRAVRRHLRCSTATSTRSSADGTRPSRRRRECAAVLRHGRRRTSSDTRSSPGTQGMQIDGIDLWALGGFTRTRGEPRPLARSFGSRPPGRSSTRLIVVACIARRARLRQLPPFPRCGAASLGRARDGAARVAGLARADQRRPARLQPAAGVPTRRRPDRARARLGAHRRPPTARRGPAHASASCSAGS